MKMPQRTIVTAEEFARMVFEQYFESLGYCETYLSFYKRKRLKRQIRIALGEEYIIQNLKVYEHDKFVAAKVKAKNFLISIMKFCGKILASKLLGELANEMIDVVKNNLVPRKQMIA